MLAVPFSHDQPDNAWRAARLGTARILLPPSYRGRRVADELAVLINDPDYAAAADRASVVLKQEGGAADACDALERLAGSVRS